MADRVKKYDYLRSISCIAIILLHVSSSYWSCVSRDSSDFVIMTVYNALTRFAVPVFMMLSGAFMLDPEKNTDFKDVWKRIGKLLISFYIWSAFFAFQGIALKLITGKEVTKELWIDSGQRFLWGHYHMWFVFLILGFYVLIPIARKICEDKKVIEYFLLLWIVVSYLLPTIAPVLKLDVVNAWVSKLSMNMLVGYLGYFLLGYYIKKFGIAKKARIVLYIAAMLGLIYSCVGTVLQSRINGIYDETLFGASSWNILVLSAAIFTMCAAMKERESCPKVISNVARYSFVIYMVHPFFLEKLNLLGITTISFNCVLSIPLLTILILVCSYVVAVILDKIPVINKVLL